MEMRYHFLRRGGDEAGVGDTAFQKVDRGDGPSRLGRERHDDEDRHASDSRSGIPDDLRVGRHHDECIGVWFGTCDEAKA